MGLTKAGKCVKIMVIMDRCGLPLSIGTHSARRREAKLVQLRLELVLIDVLPENLVGDKAYDSDPLAARSRSEASRWSRPTGGTGDARRRRTGTASAGISGVGSSRGNQIRHHQPQELIVRENGAGQARARVCVQVHRPLCCQNSLPVPVVLRSIHAHSRKSSPRRARARAAPSELASPRRTLAPALRSPPTRGRYHRRAP